MNLFKQVRMNKLLIDVQWAFISTAISSVVYLLLRVMLGKDLGPSGLGIYTIVFTIYLFGMQFSNFGIGVALTKYLAEGDEHTDGTNRLVSIGIIGSLMSGLIFAALLFLASDVLATDVYHYPGMGLLLKLVAFSFPFIALQKSVLGILNGRRTMSYFALLNILQNGLMMAVTLALVIVFKMGLIGTAIGILVPTALVGLISILLVKNFLLSDIRQLWPVLGKFYRFGGYVTLNNVVVMLNTQINVLIAGYFINSTEVGYFSVAGTLMQGIILIPSSIQLVNGPLISRLYAEKNYEGIRRVLKKSMAYSAAITVILACALAVAGNYIIGLVFTKEYLPSHPLVLMLIPGYVVYSLLVSVGATLTYIGKVDVVTRLSIICSTISLLLNLLFIACLKLPGAALATSVSLIITAFINLFVIYKVLDK